MIPGPLASERQASQTKDHTSLILGKYLDGTQDVQNDNDYDDGSETETKFHNASRL